MLLPPGAYNRHRPQTVAISPLLRQPLITLTGPTAPTGPRRQRMLAVAIDQIAEPAEPALALPQPRDPRLAAVAAAFQTEPAGIPTSKLAADAGLSQRSLSRLVRDQLGMTLPQLRTLCRLTASLVLLTDHTPITTTAYRCGWHSTSNYIAAFRTVFSRTPGAYQRSLQHHPHGQAQDQITSR